MLFILISILMLVVGAIMMYYTTSDLVFFIGFLLVIIGAAMLLVLIGRVVVVHFTAEVDYMNTIHERETLVYRLEHMEENLVGNELLFNDIVAFNNELRKVKTYANNLWTNWFNNQKIATIDYIQLPQ